ncbi:isoprenoid biosynthesis glyoxalase ElbB [Vibrio mediterranei]|uniref:isoprenoid biosynthesis glyoxalase ElbB n=1 Tax=Vibrio TaxID=662 RepID=UPI0040689AA1
MEKKVAVVLSGCGVFDGSEINEVVLTLLALEEIGLEYQCYAPDKEQLHTINHLTSDDTAPVRNVLTESARIVRGNVSSLSQLNPDNYCGLIVPGGFGVAKNLSTFAIKGKELTIDDEFQKVMKKFAQVKKTVGFMCIAPVLLPLIYSGVRCTIGNDLDTKNIIKELGGLHIDCSVEDIVVDSDFNVVTTPAYMLAENIAQAKKGIDKLVQQVYSMI